MATEGKPADVPFQNNYAAWDAAERVMELAPPVTPELHFLSMWGGSQIIQEYKLEQSKNSNKNGAYKDSKREKKKKKAENNANPVLSMAKAEILSAFLTFFDTQTGLKTS